MTHRFVHAVAGLLAAAVVLGVCAAAQGQTETIPSQEHWYVVELDGQRCGYMHTTIEPLGDEVHTRTNMSMRIRRGKVELTIGIEQHQRETRDGRPLAFRNVLNLGREPMVIEGEIRQGRLRLVQDQFGVRHESEHPFDPEAKFAWGLYLEQKDRGLAPGTRFTVKSYDPSIRVDGGFDVLFEIHDKETVLLPGGVKRTLTKVCSTIQLQTPITSFAWVDDDAETLVMDFNMGGFALRVLSATKDEALQGGEAPELFINTFVPADRDIPQEAQAVTYRLRLPHDGEGAKGAGLRSDGSDGTRGRDGDAGDSRSSNGGAPDDSGPATRRRAASSSGNSLKLPDLPNTAMQTVRRLNDYEAEVTIRRLDWDALRRVRTALTSDESIAPYLRASSMLDTNDKRIKRHARKAVRRCTTPAEKADALRKYVTDYVKDKGLDVGFATASEVVRSRSGDCSEHAVLLAAMARSAGLPARGVSGIVRIPPGPLSPEDKTLFGYHMWTQVYFGGRWVDIDAAMRQTDCDATHIALAVLPLNDEGLIDSMLPLLPLLGRLEIEVVKIEPASVETQPKAERDRPTASRPATR